MPGNTEGKLMIDEKKMELDSVKLYKMLFENTKEPIEILIVNTIEEGVDDGAKKKGLRVCKTIQELCDEICKEINKKCFPEEL